MSSPYSQNYGQQNYGQYGAPPPPYAAPRPPIRPRVLWIVLSWVLFLVLLVVGIAGFAGSIFSTINDAAPTTTLSSGETVTVQLNPADKPAIWAAANQATDVECQVQGADPSQKPTLTQPTVSQNLTVNGDNWELLFKVGVPAAGQYQVNCVGEGVKFGVGKELASGEAAATVGGGLAMLALPILGFLFAVVVTIVVLVKRSGARKRQSMY
ncbi:hypothetical protein GCM10009555_043740 [Acrocarpospora macrocephala]|uniref:Uncharacterized protein n=1 Tax=Acrocarpospora macrocephala TaxID=150177 RepID=A0A5M3WIW4_9ACTN|nr:hypothetical protein [Acrocarpospora macrocephala]GES06963.1 hypothetical protein Amac_005580 [Acrocarpospora macrocephala]